jgi:hypothetical protein
MNPQSRMTLALARIASVTSIQRTRREEMVRAEHHGGADRELAERMTDMAARLEGLAAEMERSLA